MNARYATTAATVSAQTAANTGTVADASNMPFRGRANPRGERVYSMNNTRGEFGTIEVTPAGSYRLLVAAVAIQAVEDVREWRRRGLLAGRKIVADLYAHNYHTRMQDGYKTNAAEVHQTVAWIESGAAQAFVRQAGIPYKLPEVY